MKDQIEKLKQELREFLELSKVITPEKWHVIEPFGAFDCAGIEAGDKSVVVIGIKNEDDAGVRTGIKDAAFIARSRNISPALAECLLEVIEYIEGDAETFEETCPRGRAARSRFQQILTIWEATK